MKIKKYIKLISFIIIIIIIYVLNYFNTIRHSEFFYHKVYFPELYFDFEEYFKDDSRYLITHRDYGALGTGFILLVNNKNGKFKLSQKNSWAINNDTIYFSKGKDVRRKVEDVVFIKKVKDRTSFYYDENFSNINELKRFSIYKKSKNDFSYLCKLYEINNLNKLSEGEYVLTYPGFIYDTLMTVDNLK